MQNQSINNVTWTEALEEYGLNFELEKTPLFHTDKDGNFNRSPNLFGIRRVDTSQIIPGVAVAKNYEVIQTSAYADIGNKVCGGMNAEFVKGGLSHNNKIAWLQAKLPDVIRVKSTNDIIQKYITFINGLGGNKSFHLIISGTRIFCENQIPSFMRDGRALRIRHTKSAQDQIRSADKVILETNNLFRGFELKINSLASSKFTDEQMMLVCRRLFNVEEKENKDISTRTMNNINSIMNRFQNDDDTKMWRGTGWSAHNAISAWVNHDRSLRKNTDRDESNLIGSGVAFMKKGFHILDNVIGN